MTFQRILVTRMKYIGDVVLTTPIIQSLREAYPDAHIAYLGDSKAVSLLTQNPYLNEIIPFDFSKDSFRYQLKMFWKMYSEKFDLTIDLYSNPRSALLTFATRAGVRIGGDSRGRGNLYTVKIQDDGALKSAIAYHYQSLQPLGIKPTHSKTEIFLTEGEQDEAKERLRSMGVDLSKRIVVLHPGATWPNKIWFKENFASLIHRLIAETDCEILLSPGPHDDALMDSLSHNHRSRVYTLPLLPIRTLAALLSQCSVFVSNDCGPMHVGVAVGVKTIGIFGPEPVEIWFPYDRFDGHIPMSKKIFCSPCRTTHCFRKDNDYLECMTLITVDEVFHAVKDRL